MNVPLIRDEFPKFVFVKSVELVPFAGLLDIVPFVVFASARIVNPFTLFMSAKKLIDAAPLAFALLVTVNGKLDRFAVPDALPIALKVTSNQQVTNLPTFT
jgi:hypothetical protein